MRGSGPQLAYVLFSSTRPRRLAEFYAKLFRVAPVRATADRSYSEFRLGGVTLAIAGRPRSASRRNRKPAAAAHGSSRETFVFSVPDFDDHLRRARRQRVRILDLVAEVQGDRAVSLLDPDGRVIELSERVF